MQPSRITKHLAIEAVFLLSFLAGAPANAFTLEPHLEDHRQPREPIVVTAPDGTADAQLQNLTVELDSIDITAMMVRNGRQLSYTPLQALAYGEHELRIVEFQSDGGIQEVGYWRFEVRRSALFRESNFGLSSEFTLSQRVADKNIDDQVDEFSAQGGARLQGAASNDNFGVNGFADLMYVNNRALSPTHRKLEMANYLVTAGTEKTAFKVGHQNYNDSNLLSDGYQKRGLSLTRTLRDDYSNVSVFSMSSNDIIGFDDSLGVNESDNRFSGASINYLARQSETAEIFLSTTYVSGRDTEDSFATFETDPPQIVNEGDAWNLVLDGSFFSQQLRLRLEGAQSNYDFDGVDVGIDELDDDAYSALALYTPRANADSDLAWSMGLETTKVGRFYRSIANNNLPTDRYLKRFFSNAQVAKFSVGGSYFIEDSNLGDDLLLSTTETRQWVLNGRYSDPEAFASEDSIYQWLGAPDYNLQIAETQIEDDFTAATEIPNNSETQFLNTTATFSHPTWNWSLGYTYQDFEDFTDWQVDTRTSTVLFNAGAYIGEEWSLNSGIQWQRTLNRDFGTTAKANIYNFGANFLLLKNRLYGNVNIAFSQNRAANDPFFAQDDETLQYSGEIAWRLKVPEDNQLGFDVSLSISSLNFDNHLVGGIDTDVYQVFLNFRSTTVFGATQ